MGMYYSCDSHVVEPPEVFASLEARFGSRAPRILQNPEGKRGTSIAFGKTIMRLVWIPSSGATTTRNTILPGLAHKR